MREESNMSWLIERPVFWLGIGIGVALLLTLVFA